MYNYNSYYYHHNQDEGSFPLLTDDWGAIEEVLLLDAVEQDGFGNWYAYMYNSLDDFSWPKQSSLPMHVRLCVSLQSACFHNYFILIQKLNSVDQVLIFAFWELSTVSFSSGKINRFCMWVCVVIISKPTSVLHHLHFTQTIPWFLQLTTTICRNWYLTTG